MLEVTEHICSVAPASTVANMRPYTATGFPLQISPLKQSLRCANAPKKSNAPKEFIFEYRSNTGCSLHLSLVLQISRAICLELMSTIFTEGRCQDCTPKLGFLPYISVDLFG